MQLDIPEGSFQGYLFDCDGTLADTMPLHYLAWIDVLSRHGANDFFPEEVFYSLGGVSSLEIISLLNRRHGTQMDPIEVSHEKEAAFMKRLDHVDPITAVLEYARNKAGLYPLGVVSGGLKPVVHLTLEKIGATELFPVVITPEDVRYGKPAPDMFLLAAERLGVDPKHCLVFEDGQSGIDGARAAGMSTVWVPSHPYEPIHP
ncbi:MAG: HAD family hydrolase [Candidatus Methylacidiphilales bacterium]